MRQSKSDLPFIVGYLVVLVVQLPVWLGGGLLWAVIMAALGSMPAVNALIGGIAWGFAMWVVCGSFFAVGLAWRRFAELPATDRPVFRAALAQVCDKLRLTVLVESADEVVLGPKRALVRFRLAETRVEFAAGAVVISGPALSFWTFKRALARALAQPSAGE